MYHNPVEVIETDNWLKKSIEVEDKLKIRNPLVITSKGNLLRQKLSLKYKPESIFCDTRPDPTFESCKEAINFIDISKFDGVLAIGGGSVMDTAKVVMAYIGTGINDIKKLLKIKSSFKNKVPSIFIPTTHGTGSEVTMWGTIWNTTEKKKYSISHPDLYPSTAILDGQLTLSLPLTTSIVTIMDALSHSFESIWNKNANPISTKYAIEAIKVILSNVDKFKKNPKNNKIRTRILIASNKAGLAFSNTKTAAAHAISYPLTQYYGIPHGIAASMSLIPLLKINHDKISNILKDINRETNIRDSNELINKIKDIPKGIINFSLRQWGVNEFDIENTILPKCFTPGRMENNIIKLNLNDVRNILSEI
tara:strand:+ start:5235 stop:6329 length:1095 start_codon:yes stop_codon:yes gene_type:complete